MGDRAGHRPPYDTVANLIRFATANRRELDGILLMRGVDLPALPMRRALSVLWAIALEGRDDKERSKMIAQLTAPSARRAARSREDFFAAGYEQDAAAFMLAARGGGGGEGGGVDMSDAFG